MSVFKERKAGVLMPIFSLPNKYGIGTIGKSAFDFIRYLRDAGQKYWQILPIHPPAVADSPYMCLSAIAGNPFFIDIDWLVGDGWLTQEQISQCDLKPAPLDIEGAGKWNSPYVSSKIDYKQIHESRGKVFTFLFENFQKNQPNDFEEFCQHHSNWLDNYALFMAILEDQNYREVQDWDLKYKKRDKEALKEFSIKHQSTLLYWKMIQYFFYMQWRSLQKYAHQFGIKIIGDIPLYVSLTSSDAWAHPEIFDIDENFDVKTLSGCPPNKSNNKKSTGQCWGTPVYNWDYLKKTNYKWWFHRLESALDLYDIVRIDHFKGFENYYNIDAKTRDSLNGQWKPGPSVDFWEAARVYFGKENIADLPFIAEDLGIITQDLRNLLESCGFPGMKVMQYAFNWPPKKAHLYKPENKKQNYQIYCPHNYPKNCISYLGTHDTTTLAGYLAQSDNQIISNATTYFGLKDDSNLYDTLIKAAMKSNANTCILQAQDLLKLSDDARTNSPGTTGINWKWQMTDEEFSALDAKAHLKLTTESERN